MVIGPQVDYILSLLQRLPNFIYFIAIYLIIFI